MAVGGGRAGWSCSRLCGSRGSMFNGLGGGIKVEACLLEAPICSDGLVLRSVPH